jgi:hypothetical protein
MRKFLVIFALLLIVMTSCKRVVLMIDSIPENTPPGQQIYVTGNFNNWDPGEGLYIMNMDKDSNYFITLPPGFGTVDYKFTRGDWTTVEKSICGEEMENRRMEVAANDTVTCSIKSWGDLDPLDCPKLTLKIENLPENTPPEDIIALASSANSWDPDNSSIFNKSTDGELFLTIERPQGINFMDYKITRGDLSTSESDEFGNQILSRVLKFGKRDTITVDVKGWTDLQKSKSNRVVFIIKSLPENTPPFDKLYLASNLNSWVTNDKNYEFQLNKNGQLFYPVLRKDMLLEYKITRGDWDTQEVDKNGFDISNRHTELYNTDTVFINIERWKDMGDPGDDDITITLTELPESTPHDAKLYISGDFNGWDPGKLRHRFHKDINGNYSVNLPRKHRHLEFRITRGDWETAEVDKYGSDIIPHKYHYHNTDSLKIVVENWKDKPLKQYGGITIVLDSLPEITAPESPIYIVSEYNNWNPMDNQLTFNKLSNGKHAITLLIMKDAKSLEYKITRGGWSRVEVDEYGDEIQNRKLYFGFADTVFIDVKKWRDFGGNY